MLDSLNLNDNFFCKKCDKNDKNVIKMKLTNKWFIFMCVRICMWVKGKENPGNSPKETVFFFNLRVRVTNTAECPLGFFSLCFLRPLKTPCEVQQLETLVVPCVLVRTWFCNLVNSAPISTYNLSQATNEYFPSVSWVNFKSLENKKGTKV